MATFIRFRARFCSASFVVGLRVGCWGCREIVRGGFRFRLVSVVFWCYYRVVFVCFEYLFVVSVE